MRHVAQRHQPGWRGSKDREWRSACTSDAAMPLSASGQTVTSQPMEDSSAPTPPSSGGTTAITVGNTASSLRALATTTGSPAAGKVWSSLLRCPSGSKRRPLPAASKMPRTGTPIRSGDADAEARSKGSLRSRLPVSLNSALAKAGASGGRPGSPRPVGGSFEGTMCTSTCGMSFMRATV
jgi:hypothetical protein